MYNSINNLNSTFDSVVVPGAPEPRVDMAGYPGGQPYLSSNPMNPGNTNKNYLQTTNGQVKISVSTRTTDQRKINSSQLCFVDNNKFDQPKLMSLQAVNKMIVEYSSPLFSNGTFLTKMGDMDKKENIINRFKLLGVVSNNDSDDVLRYRYPNERNPRTFTVVTWGDCFILNYWSNNKHKILRPYDECYLVLKRVQLTNGHSYQTDLTVGRLDIPEPFDRPIDMSKKYWQWVPYSCKGGIPSAQLLNTHENYKKKKTTDLGSYIRIGKVHEYADVGRFKDYEVRDEYSVSRDVAYLHRNGRVRPLQFYLHMDDETRMI